MSGHPYHGGALAPLQPPLAARPLDRAAALAALALALGAGLVLFAGQPIVATVIAALAPLLLALSATSRLRQARAELAALQAELERLHPLAEAGLTTAGFAHELKNGLMVTQGFAELARKAAEGGGTPPKALARLGEVEAQANRLVAQLQSFLRLAQGRAAERIARPLAEVVAEAGALVAPIVRQKERAFVHEPFEGPEAQLPVPDPDVREAVVNLLLNAAAHAQSTVRLRLSRAADAVEIVVEDDGPGVAPDLAGRLFTPFARGGAEGTGLGLWSVQRAAALAGGKVRYEQAENGGARFVLALPVARDLGARPGPVVGSAHG